MFHVKWCHPEFMRGNAHERGTLRHSSPPLPSSGQTLKRAVGVSRFQIVNSKTCEIYNLKSTICNPAIFLLHNVPCEAVSSRTHARKRAWERNLTSFFNHHRRRPDKLRSPRSAIQNLQSAILATHSSDYI